ncbi:SRPBCC domain-containing protein [Streptomyces sp. STR69]|uniref:SRPBCC domain-containing protein n=1 Tax=Streptomyces sp. STR69 TaxID=1796942 RepID=UPI0021C7ABCA|nr:SRPBCC domain-containing protein [Streptomyces sp. STR69]
MEHEVHVPVPPERLRSALGDPARVARAVPGLQQDAGTEPVAGRLKVRVGGHSITYRGSVRVSARDDGSYAVEGDATEVRGSGSVKLALTVRVRESDGGSTITFDGTATADGRVTELAPDAVSAATTRLLERFAANLGEEPEQADDTDDTDDVDDVDAVEVDDVDDVEADDVDLDDPEVDLAGAIEELHVSETFAETPQPPAEAAHARRTMIGRSAEEVDHAPPRGRYAPVPAPQTVSANATLRWAAPAAALVLASAIVVNRVLRKRR